MILKKSVCLKVRKAQGEKAIVLANKMAIADKELEIQRNYDFIYIPLIRQPQKDELKLLKKQIPNFQITAHAFPKRKKRAKSFLELLEDKLPPHLLASLPRALDFVGEIAIIELQKEVVQFKDLIGEAILKSNKNVRTVLAKAGAVEGAYRLRDFTVIAGEPKTATIHKEHGCQYYVDLSKAYFSPRLSYEHKRIASLAREGEIIVDLFAGVGPFAILIAKTHLNVKVYAIDVNPDAVEYLKRNVRLNRVEGKVHPILGDARQIVNEKLSGVADRVIMNLPEKASEFIDVACTAIKPNGGVVHFYSFVSSPDSLESVERFLREAVEEHGRKVVKVLFSRFVRETAPYEWQAVVDAEIR